MKAEIINPIPGVYDFTQADQLVDFAEKHNLFLIGHTLVWHNQTPDWFFRDDDGNPNTSQAQIERMRHYIETVAGRYAGRVDAWDVVNEVIDNDGSYRLTVWVSSIGSGDELVKLAFKFAMNMPRIQSYTTTLMRGDRPNETASLWSVRRPRNRIDGIGIQGTGDLIIPRPSISRPRSMRMPHWG